MTNADPVVLILGSGPNAVQAAKWPKAWFDQIVVMNNAWQVRADWDALVFPEDFDMGRMPPEMGAQQRLVGADDFVPAQNAYGGFVHAGATMAFTTAYWVLAVLKPRVIAFMGCDMVYPQDGDTHFYGTGTADPLRDDVTLRDLGAKSARLALIAAVQGCGCVNLSQDVSSLLLARAQPETLRDQNLDTGLDRELYRALRAQEDALGYATPDGRYNVTGKGMDIARLDALDLRWRALFDG
jgi:hypothetical protein